ncbi:VOC family protein [Pseudaminobacter soli (ex Li et al. 2025)]|uniref:VOC family protein n=1 Tax=Pseudaminobacter soli (ex Li et al. 2025) TaxID=1295366 RepID=UPI002476E9E4|nr:VOC family protein [Mesorhizobium soli]
MRLNRIVLYARNVAGIVDFYERHFGFEAHRQEGDRIVELICPNGGANLLIHQAGKAQKVGQSAVKLVLDVEDVEAFREACAKNGLNFGPLHQADGYVFANARDPNGNSISISSRAYRGK